MASHGYPAVAILGPTGSGKSFVGTALATRFSGEIVSCDALQVYRGMNIGTAKASAEERRLIPHHMLDLKDPCENFSAGDYQKLARDALFEIRSRKRIPFVVGGTGFYFRALTDGFFEGPGRSEWLRARMRRIVQRRGPECLHAALRNVDPASAARISPGDSSRVVRAYEIYLVTRRTMSWWQQQPRETLQGFRWLKLAIEWPRDILYRRINRRVDEMVEAGFVDEVRSLTGRYACECHAFKAIGYRQLADHIEGRCSLAEAIESTKMESRRYAKRQLTWFRGLEGVAWLEGSDNLEDLCSRAGSLVTDFLNSPYGKAPPA